MTLVCYLGGRLISSFPRRRKLWLVISLTACLGLLAFFKYTGFFLENLQALTAFPKEIPQIVLPIGISFYTFQLLSYVVDVYRGEVPAQKSYPTLLLYASLFHQCIAGPIIRYRDVEEELLNRRPNRSDVSRGVTRFSVGLAKKAVLANGCAMIVKDLIPEGAEALSQVSAAGILLAAVCFMLEIYLDFSAYSDMAIGMGLMIGFHYRENFNYPYIADSVTGFWRRWHISLSSFFRDYVYIPLGGNRVRPWRHILNLFIVWALTGLWHGASWNFLLWGLYYFLLLTIEKYLIRPPKVRRGFSRVLGTAATLILVLFGWMIFYYPDLSMLTTAVRGLFTGNGNPWLDARVKLELLNYLFFLPVAILACTPILPALRRFTETCNCTVWKLIYRVAEAVLPMLLVILSVLALAGDSYNPFLYTRF